MADTPPRENAAPEPATPVDRTSPPSADLIELGEIIRAYSAATEELQQSHELLQRQIMQLTGELQRKNRELSETVTQVSSLKNYLAGIIQSSADGIIAIDTARRIMAWNPAANVLAGLGGVVPEKPEGKFILDALSGPCREFAMMLMRSMQEGRAFSGVEMRIADPSGRLHYFSASASPVWNEAEDGAKRHVGAVLIFSELTEIRELEERANRQDRLAALGEMAAGVAHEIRNPLGGIELYASNLRRKFGAETGEHATCGKIIAAAASLNRIVTDMLTFTRSRPPGMRMACAGPLLRGALDMAARDIEGKNIQVRLDLPEKEEPRRMDPDQLVQAALNVILNAVQVMEQGGTLSLSIAEEAVPGRDGKDLVIVFADDGPGIPPEARDKIFHPFFTLRKDGTGLGLAIVHKIIQDHGGSIEVADNQPRGARIAFRLPPG